MVGRLEIDSTRHLEFGGKEEAEVRYATEEKSPEDQDTTMTSHMDLTSLHTVHGTATDMFKTASPHTKDKLHNGTCQNPKKKQGSNEKQTHERRSVHFLRWNPSSKRRIIT